MHHDYIRTVIRMNHPSFPIQAYSWTIISPHEFIKEIDKSVLHHHGSGIPMEIKEYFGVQELRVGEQSQITLNYQGQTFEAKIVLDIEPQPRARMLWKADFSQLLNEQFPGWYELLDKEEAPTGIKPKIRFIQKDTSTYEISFITEKNSADSVAKKPDIKPLRLYNQYSRKEVHDIFTPYSGFTQGSGTWGNHGIVKTPNRKNDFVFFVTFGQKQAGHTFEESIDENGILTWQSQPSQDLNNPQIQQFIHHDHLTNNIYLFLRTKKAADFTYLGRLAYINHDPNSNNPVYFKWQILDWDINHDKIQEAGLTFCEPDAKEEHSSDLYIPTPPPAFGTKEATPPNFYSQHVNFAENQIKNKACGDAGELFVLEYEKQFLVENGRPDLTEQVRHIAYLEGDGAGYDIESRTIKGEVKYIEVKTTTGGEKTPFIITANELAFSQCYSEHYYLYRVYNFNIKDGKGLFYILQGDIAKNAPLEPIQYRTKV